jgi:nicotinamidase-related amidase
MTEAKTLLELAGADLTPATVHDATVVFIDLQNEYRKGPIAVTGVDEAVEQASRLLGAAREQGAPVIHVAHKGRPGSLFDRDAARGRIVEEMTPQAGEEVLEKGLPNAFAGTGLQALLESAGRTNIILAGFMTHMCISSTARAALDLGYRVTIDAAACGSRDLPDGRGGVIPAATVHDVALVELSDRFAIIARGDGDTA